MTAPAAVRGRITVRGTVQGVGFRPFVHRIAGELRLAGFVRNGPEGVVIEVEGPAERVADFRRRLTAQAPPLADVREVTEVDVAPCGGRGFTIDATGAAGGGRPCIPPDTATCEDCLRELADPRDRRHRHPFIACTHCGPRWTMTVGLPYDRAGTTMAGFPLCAACEREYRDPADRRFHAQPLACRDCGPTLRLSTADDPPGSPGPAGDEAMAGARRLLAGGAIVAVKGLGGYHLACDAADPAAVALLRERKVRPGKPFAVMCAGLREAERIARIGPAEAAVLTGRRRPIVLLRRRPGQHGPAGGVCPGSPHIGVMLPYTPVHHLLFGLPGDAPGPGVLVMTSGNRSGEPLVTGDAEARERLAGLADAWLWHDREVAAPCDDSVVRVRADGTAQVLRRARGHVPEPLPLPAPVPPSLAVGGDLKNTLCLAAGREAWLSPHIGDMADLATRRAHRAAGDRLAALTGVTPRLVAADAHPGYASSHRAVRTAAAAGVPLRRVQHHHAHLASLMAEHGLDGGRPVLGVAFDGTGYGTDGTVWGGEWLLAGRTGFRRLGHLAPAPLPGGDAGTANPCRQAIARLHAAGLPRAPGLPCVRACSAEELRLLEAQLDRGLACVPTSGAGRLFDAVSSLAGVCHRAGYEAQAALELEAAALTAPAEDGDGYPMGLRPARGREPAVLDPAPMLRAVLADLRAATPAGVIAARFHRGLAAGTAALCERLLHGTGVTTVGLTGGVFANALLEDDCARRLAAVGLTVLRHHRVPPGDGGLAYGQIVAAAAPGATGAGAARTTTTTRNGADHVPGGARQSDRDQ